MSLARSQMGTADQATCGTARHWIDGSAMQIVHELAVGGCDDRIELPLRTHTGAVRSTEPRVWASRLERAYRRVGCHAIPHGYGPSAGCYTPLSVRFQESALNSCTAGFAGRWSSSDHVVDGSSRRFPDQIVRVEPWSTPRWRTILRLPVFMGALPTWHRHYMRFITDCQGATRVLAPHSVDQPIMAASSRITCGTLAGRQSSAVPLYMVGRCSNAVHAWQRSDRFFRW